MSSKKNGVVFGLEINPDEKKEKREQAKSFALPPSTDGAMQLAAAGTGYGAGPLSQSFVLSLDSGVASEAELIERYRTIALYPQADLAIQEISGNSIIQDDDDPCVDIDLDGIPDGVIGDPIKKKIHFAFDHVKKLLDFDRRGDQIFQRWYIDSRIAYHKIVDPDKIKDGITELRQIDPRKIKKVREVRQTKIGGVDVYDVVSEYYVYIESASTYNKTFQGHTFGDAVIQAGAGSFGTNAIKVSLDSVAFCHSGLVDPSSGVVYGYIQKAIKPFNQLRMLEDSVIIYRLARATERRAFYVDTGILPPGKAEFYVNQLKNRYRTKITYDAKTGEVSDKRQVLSLQEDYWIPRLAGSKGTEVASISGAQNLGVMDDVMHFKDNLWNALNVPSSRFKSDGAQALFGGGAEINREELKFSKFIDKLRAQFAGLFSDVLKTQLILTNVLTEEEWLEIEQFVKFVWARDSHWAEARDAEILQRRLSNLAIVDPYVGRYFSRKWVQKKVLKMSDDDIEEMNREMLQDIKDEQKNPRLANPSFMNSPDPNLYGLPAPQPPESS